MLQPITYRLGRLSLMLQLCFIPHMCLGIKPLIILLLCPCTPPQITIQDKSFREKGHFCLQKVTWFKKKLAANRTIAAGSGAYGNDVTMLWHHEVTSWLIFYEGGTSSDRSPVILLCNERRRNVGRVWTVGLLKHEEEVITICLPCFKFPLVPPFKWNWKHAQQISS